MTERTDIIPAELASLSESLAYEENGRFIIERINFVNQIIHLDFTVSAWDWETETSQLQRWQLQVADYRSVSLNTGQSTLYQGSRFRFYSEHPILWPFSANQIAIYTQKPAADYQKLLADIYEFHQTTLGSFISPDAFTGSSVFKCQLPYGLFASGPPTVLSRYFDFLTAAGAEPYYYPPVPDNVLPPTPPDTYNGLKLAVLEGSYFIGTDFIFERLE